MGEKINDITQIRLGKSDFLVELNEPLAIGRDYQIHIQNDKFRFECGMGEFLQMAGGIIDAEKKLEIVKRGKNEDLLWTVKHNKY